MTLKRFLSELNIVNEEDVRIVKYNEKKGLVTCQVGSVIYEDLAIRRPFPITNPNFLLFISNSNGKIAFVVRDMTKLRKDVKEIIERLLNMFYFMPIIRRIYSINTSGDEFVWDVDTDRGRTTIKTRGRSSVISIGQRVVIVDVNDIIYQILDVNKLDKRSRRLIENLL